MSRMIYKLIGEPELALCAGGGGGGLPEDYRALAGITMNADTYYVITDFRLRGRDTLRFSFSANKACNVLGCYTSTSAETNYSLYATTSSGRYLRYDGGTYNSAVNAGERYDVEITSTGTTGFKTDSTWEAKDFTTESDFLVGATSVSASSSKMDGSFFGNIEVAGRLKLIPCERIADGVIGYYDQRKKVFYEPAVGSPEAIEEE